MAQLYLDDEEFGRMYLTPRLGQRSMRIGWKGEHLNITMPYGTTQREILDIINSKRDRIRKLPRHTVEYHVGQRIQCFRTSVTIGTQNKLPGKLIFGHEGNDLYLNIPEGTDLTSEPVKRAISKCLESLMTAPAQDILIPYATDIAKKFKLRPASFVIGRGQRKLGHCTPKRVIMFSHNVMFLSEELVNLIVCHELAHLTHMDHSAEFHALCDYYVGGHEKELNKKLKNFDWPIVK